LATAWGGFGIEGWLVQKPFSYNPNPRLITQSSKNQSRGHTMSAQTSKARTEAFFAALAETGNQTISAERNIDFPKTVSYIRHK
jgi:hypothetical protein